MKTSNNEKKKSFNAKTRIQSTEVFNIWAQARSSPGLKTKYYFIDIPTSCVLCIERVSIAFDLYPHFMSVKRQPTGSLQLKLSHCICCLGYGQWIASLEHTFHKVKPSKQQVCKPTPAWDFNKKNVQNHIILAINQNHTLTD